MSNKKNSKWVSSSEKHELNPPNEGKDAVLQRTNYREKPVLADHKAEDLGFLGRLNYRWRVATTLELLDPWERAVFNTAFLATVSMAAYYSYAFVKQYI